MGADDGPVKKSHVRLFPNQTGHWQCQTGWPLRTDYQILEVGESDGPEDDGESESEDGEGGGGGGQMKNVRHSGYEYAVVAVGSPYERKHVFVLARGAHHGSLDDENFERLLRRLERQHLFDFRAGYARVKHTDEALDARYHPSHDDVYHEGHH